MTCQQELRPNEYISTGIVYAGAKQRCTMTAEGEDRSAWKVPLRDGGTAEIVGLLADGSVVGQVSGKESNAGQLVIWKKDQAAEVLPWIPKDFYGSFQSATADMSRYTAFATCDDRSDNGRWFVFDRRSQTPLVNRLFPKNGRAALSPDGSRYASFEPANSASTRCHSPTSEAKQRSPVPFGSEVPVKRRAPHIHLRVFQQRLLNHQFRRVRWLGYSPTSSSCGHALV